MSEIGGKEPSLSPRRQALRRGWGAIVAATILGPEGKIKVKDTVETSQPKLQEPPKKP